MPGRSVFISHAEEDEGLAVEIANGIESSGVSAWYFERDSDPGPSYLMQVHQAIEECTAFVVLITPASLQSHQMTKEIYRAHETGKAFIPVRHQITHAEFQKRQPEWNIAIGAAASITIPAAGAAAIVPRIVRGLRHLGIGLGKEPAPVSATPAPVPPDADQARHPGRASSGPRGGGNPRRGHGRS